MHDTQEQIADNIEQSLQQGFENTFVTWRDSNVFTANDIVLYFAAVPAGTGAEGGTNDDLPF